MGLSSTFPLTSRLPSICSAVSFRADLVRRLRWYYAAVRLPVVVHRRRASSDFPTRPALPLAGDDWLSRFSLNMFPHMLGVLDRAEPVKHFRLFIALSSVAFELRRHSRHSGFSPFRSSIPNLCVPLSTLGLLNYFNRPMTRSQTGWLRLVCSGLSPPTYCRFLPAHLRQEGHVYSNRGSERTNSVRSSMCP